MRPARLDQSIRNAMQGPSDPALGGGDTAPGPPIAARGGLKGLARRLLKAPASLFRAFLIGPAVARVDGLAHQIQALSRDLQMISADAQARHAEMARLMEHQAVRLDTIWSSLGGRFDELEYKVRPLLPYDDAFGVRLGDGYVLIPRDQPILLSMAADATSGGFEPGTRRVLKALIEPGMRVADVGANIGLLTLACARAVGPRGQVFSFEPEETYRALLAKSLALNGLAWVDLQGRAVGRRNERLNFHVSTIPGHSSLYPLPPEETPESGPAAVEVVRLDDAIGPDLRLDVVKIDVEGAELDVLAGMERVLAASPDLAIVAEYGPAHLSRVGLTPEQWLGAFETQGFDAYAIAEPQGTCRPVKLSDLADVVSVNLAFVRPNGRAVGRLPR